MLNHVSACCYQGIVSTVAGSGMSSFGDGVGTTASFREPFGISITPSGNIIVSDIKNSLIRSVTTSGVFPFNWLQCIFNFFNLQPVFPVGVVSTLAGSLVYADGIGTLARFSVPGAVAASPAGTLVVADSGNNTIRLVSNSGQSW